LRLNALFSFPTSFARNKSPTKEGFPEGDEGNSHAIFGVHIWHTDEEVNIPGRLRRKQGSSVRQLIAVRRCRSAAVSAALAGGTPALPP
jgi:hypothetical protein